MRGPANLSLVLLLLILAFAVYVMGITLTAPPQPIVCNANEEATVTKEQSYGTVSKLTCWRGSFNGPEVTILFVD